MTHHRQGLVCIWLFLMLLAPALSSASGPAKKKTAAPSVHAQWLAEVLSTGAESLTGQIKDAASRTALVQSGLAQTSAELQQLQMKMAVLKAGMEVETLSAPVIAEILSAYSANEQDVSSRLDKLAGKIKESEKGMAKLNASRSAIDAQVKVLKGLKLPGAWSDQVQTAYDKYIGACNALTDGSRGLAGALTEEARLLKQEKELLDGVLPGLKGLQQASMAQLLQNGGARPLGHQLADLCCRIGDMPGQAWSWFSGQLESGRIQGFLLKTWAPLIGLLLFVALLGWAVNRLKGRLELLIDYIRPDARETGVRVLVSLASSLIAMACPIAFILWLSAAYYVLGLFDVVPALIVLYILAGLAVLAMTIRVIRDVFCGTGAGPSCVPNIKGGAALSFCRRLEVFAGYVTMGFVFMEILNLNQFPITLKLLVSQLYGIGVLLWTCLLVRPGYLKKIIERPVSPGWAKWLRRAWTALLVLLIAVCFMELLGFQSFSIYAIRAAVLTEALIACALLLVVLGKGVLREIFEREHALLEVFDTAGIQLRQLYLPARLTLSALLIAGLIAGLMLAWGIGIASLMGFVSHLSKEVNLGSLHLSLVTVMASALALYGGFRGSGLVRTFLRNRILPRTGWDLGVQYSIATILQYTIIIACVLLAMNILGFPLASLALLAGALGIGAGLGLQSVIANFVSGLVLLFERPVKVGDLLIVDGHWGEVKAIKMRSTVFQTFDRSVLIIPNSDLLSGKIVNWSHYGIGPNRLTLKLGVSYSSDVKQVTRLLREICGDNPRVMKDPAPQIFFEAYGDSSLDFSIQVFVLTPADRVPATHEINTAIFEAFREKGIEIPFPQRDLHIVDDRGTPLRDAVELQPHGGQSRM